jgi:hypothetical protein
MKKKQIIIAIIVLVLVEGISFYSGYKTGQSSRIVKGANGQMFGQNGVGGIMGQNGNIRSGRPGQGGGNSMTLVSGEVLSKDATSITLKLRDGGSKIIFVATSTSVQKTVGGTVNDLVVGNQITASGPANADGSINAVTINQRPAGASFGGGVGTPQGVRN